MIDYSQSGEQELIFKALDLCGLDFGDFLDIGAGDGETFSNSRALALNGWGGRLVEPAPWAFDRLIELYADNPAVMLVQAVVTPAEMGLVTFAYSKDDHVSSIDPQHIRTWQSTVPYAKVLAAAITLNELLVGCGFGYQFVSIDAEGLTMDLVRAYAQHPAWSSIKVLCFERESEAVKRATPTPAWQGWELVGETPNNFVYRRTT